MRSVLSLCVVLFVFPAQAATHHWTGNGTNDLWSNAANWADGIPANGDDLVFDSTTSHPTSTNDLTDLAVHSFTANYVSAHLIQGNGILLGEGGISTIELLPGAGDGSLTIALPISFTADQGWTFAWPGAKVTSSVAAHGFSLGIRTTGNYSASTISGDIAGVGNFGLSAAYFAYCAVTGAVDVHGSYSTIGNVSASNVSVIGSVSAGNGSTQTTFGVVSVIGPAIRVLRLTHFGAGTATVGSIYTDGPTDFSDTFLGFGELTETSAEGSVRATLSAGKYTIAGGTRTLHWSFCDCTTIVDGGTLIVDTSEFRANEASHVFRDITLLNGAVQLMSSSTSGGSPIITRAGLVDAQSGTVSAEFVPPANYPHSYTSVTAMKSGPLSIQSYAIETAMKLGPSSTLAIPIRRDFHQASDTYALIHGDVTIDHATLSVTLVPPVRAVTDGVGSVFHVTSGSVTGTFASLPEGATIPMSDGSSYRISYADGISLTLIAQKIATTTSVTHSPSSPLVNEPITINASVASESGLPAGTVTILNNSSPVGTFPLNAGHASTTISGLPAGSYTFSAAYSGSDQHAASTSANDTVIVHAGPAPTTTSLTSSPTPSALGEAITLSALVSAASGSPTGSVTFADDGAPIATIALNSTGQAVASGYVPTTPGTHLLTAAYAGNGDFAASVSLPVSHMVNAGPCQAPAITQQPHHQTIMLQEHATLSVTATGTSLQYQWFEGHNGDTAHPISGATGNSYTIIPDFRTSEEYWVRVFNLCGSENSDTAVVTILARRRATRH